MDNLINLAPSYVPQKSFNAWCHDTIILDGKPFSFAGHEYLIRLYEEDAPFEVEKKAAQMGFSTKNLLRCIYKCKYTYPLGVLYLLSTRSDVTEFSKGKFSRLIEDNQGIRSWLAKDVGSANLKRIGEGYVYFRGTKTKGALKSIPADELVVDEFDEHDPKQIDLALERLSHSQYGYRRYLSTPTLPDYGIDLLYQQTDQRHWIVTCKCGTDNCLEDQFPDCLGELANGDVIKICRGCREKLVPVHGQWVAKRSSIPIKGVYISQLNSAVITPKAVLDSYKQHVLRVLPVLGGGVPNPKEFWNSKMGMGYVEAENRLSKEQVYACCGNYGIESSDHGPCSMGVDQRSTELHVVIGTKRFSKPRILHIGIYKDWKDLHPLMKSFNVAMCVVDGLPETRNARAFAKKHPGKVWCNFYVDERKADYAWNDAEKIVQVGRTESLDESHMQILNSEIVLPRQSDITEKFAIQCHNVAKKLEEDKEKGTKRYVYVRLQGEDHFRHAFNYECVARTRLGGGQLAGQIVTGGDMVSSKPGWDDV